MGETARRPVLVVIGRGGTIPDAARVAAEELGRLAIDAGFRVATGGLDGVMAAASRGARASARWREGDVVGVLPGGDHADANAWVDIAIPTGLSMARNVVLIAMADVVVAVAGGAGTLSELAIASQLGRPTVALTDHGGWAAQLADRAVDERGAAVEGARSPAEAIAIARRVVGRVGDGDGDGNGNGAG